ncbi:1796_t:CDS:2 [Funneliformis geosporum]|nr:1796_t:CDS:2 [Funneliformis geosporum]
MFILTSVDVGNVQLSVQRLPVPTNIITDDQMEEPKSISLRTISGNVDVNVDEKFSTEMKRITRKKPPKETTIQIIYPEFDNPSEGNTSNQVFKDLLSFPDQGKIYIGFPTHQTTGCCSHIAARMNRDSIDLVERTLSIYNEELLRITGILCRIVYEDEMFNIEQIYNFISRSNDEGTKVVREWLEKRAAHALSHFTFQKSTPDSLVGEIIESQFFNCSEQELSILSTNGVLPISCIRIPDPGIAGIIKQVPIVPNIALERCITFFDKARAMGLIRELTFQDVLVELKGRMLCEDEMVNLLKWWICYCSKGNHVSEKIEFMQFSKIRVGDISRSLRAFDYYLNPGIIPPDIDLPVEVLPYSISKNLQLKDLDKCFGFSELSLVIWAKFIVNNPNLESSPAFAERVHNILEKNLKKTRTYDKEIIRQLFVQKKCIPTEFGMKFPNEAYFQNVNLFSDLPIIKFQKPLSVQNVMQLLGVRKVVELQLIFDRLVRNNDYDHMRLVKYLASESKDLKDEEKTILKNTPIWPKENNEDNNDFNSEIQRFVISDLHVPNTLFRELGLPIINWRRNWSRNALEVKFLIELGLREFPTLKTILELAASSSTDPEIREKALKYFIDNFNEKYSKCYDKSRVYVAFLPCMEPGSYAKPLDCFINTECKIMKFKAVRQDLKYNVEQLGVRQYPDSEDLKRRLLEDPPQDVKKAKEIFEFLASQPGSSNWHSLKDQNFIPVRDKILPDEIHRINPHNCFLERFDQRDSLNFLNDFFTFIDFGENVNTFLKSCGVRIRPSSADIAELLVKSSREIWKSIDEKKYREILNRVAVDYQYEIRFYRSDLVRKMKQDPILAAMKLNGKIHLTSADKIFINDDTAYQQVFNPPTAPEEDSLKTMSLKDSVTEDAKPIGFPQETEKSRMIQKTIMERARLLYHDRKDDIKKDIEWLRKLKVKSVKHINATYSLANYKIQRKSIPACIINDILYVTRDSEFLDISQHLARNIYRSNKLDNVLHVYAILNNPLSILSKIFPVDCMPDLSKLWHIVVESDDDEAPNYQHVSKGVPVSSIQVPFSKTEDLRNFLQDSLNACRSNSRSPLQLYFETSTSFFNVNVFHLDHILREAGTIKGIKVYNTQPLNLFQSHYVRLARFVDILISIAEILQLKLEDIHVYYDDDSSKVAFNRDKALYFNFKTFLELHDEEYNNGFKDNAMYYWFVMVCHELAHNFASKHNSIHEYYLTSFVIAYIPKYIEMLKKEAINFGIMI